MKISHVLSCLIFCIFSFQACAGQTDYHKPGVRSVMSQQQEFEIAKGASESIYLELLVDSDIESVDISANPTGPLKIDGQTSFKNLTPQNGVVGVTIELSGKKEGKYKLKLTSTLTSSSGESVKNFHSAIIYVGGIDKYKSDKSQKLKANGEFHDLPSSVDSH